jgi:hypothetical protein
VHCTVLLVRTVSARCFRPCIDLGQRSLSSEQRVSVYKAHQLVCHTSWLPEAMPLISGTFLLSNKWLAGLLVTLGIVALAGTAMTAYSRSIPELDVLVAGAIGAITLSVKMVRQVE